MTYTNTFAGRNGQVPLASDANDQFDDIEAAFEEITAGIDNIGVGSGTANVQVATMPVAPAAYVAGMQIMYLPSVANTGAATVNVNALGAKTIRKHGSQVLAANDLTIGIPAVLRYSSATGFFHLLNPSTSEIGGTTPAPGAFTTLTASSTVSGAGFSTYLASPPAIGGSAPAAITGTTVTGTTLVATTGGIRSRGGDNASATNFAAGEGALDSNSGGTGNTAVGNDALTAVSSGVDNTGVGSGALAAITTTSLCTGVGYRAGYVNTAASTSAFGGFAMYSNTSGARNSAFGESALYANITGADNAVFGYRAGLSILGSNNVAIGAAAAIVFEGSNITAIGSGALASNVSGANVTAVGYLALTLNTANSNTAVGSLALTANTSGAANTAVGNAALAAMETGGSCTAVGQGALVDATGGSNTAVGASAGINIIAGTQNTYIGASAYPSVNVSNSIGIGYNARPTASNQVVIGNASVTETVLRGQVKGGAGTGTGQPAMIGTLSVNTTAVGNVGAGTDDLMTYTLPADSLSANAKGIEVFACGTVANNANAKTVGFNFGAELRNFSIDTGSVLYWEIRAKVFRTSANNQKWFINMSAGSSGAGTTNFKRFISTSTETDTAAITIKCTGIGTADNDIVQEMMLIKFIN